MFSMFSRTRLDSICLDLAHYVMLFLLTGVLFSPPAQAAISAAVNRETAKDVKVDTAHIRESYGKLPLYFIRNDGQVDPRVKFYERSAGRTTFFTEDGVYILLNKGQKADNSPLPNTVVPRFIGESQARVRGDLRKMQDSKPEPREYQMVKLLPLGANKSPKIVAENMQAGKVNYFIGNDPKQWRTNVPTYKSVLYQEAYAGIDIRFYGINRQMEYDIVVKPGADPSQVKLAYEGVEGLKVADNGDLEIALKDGGTLIQKKPYIYQEIAGKRVELAGRFSIRSFGLSQTESQKGQSTLKGFGLGTDRNIETGQRYTYTFEVAGYAKDKPLIIDPALAYSTYLGGSGNGSYGQSIAVDGSGNAYVTGWTCSTDFPVTDNAIQSHHAGDYNFEDAFVTKINTAGDALAYSTYLGGNATDWGHSVAVDSAGNAYVTGHTGSPNFPVTDNAIQSHIAGGFDAFVTKINAAGNALAYSTYLGGGNNNPWGGMDGDDRGWDIAVDSNGNAYVTGDTSSTDFPVTDNAIQSHHAENGSYWGDVFVTKINAAGSALAYSTYLGGSGGDEGWGIAVDSAGNAYVTGGTNSPDFPTQNPIQGSLAGRYYDAFVTKINAAGSALTYSTYLGGGTGSDEGYGIAIDRNGNAYITGETYSTDFPVTDNAIQSHHADDRGTYGHYQDDAFVAKINAAGNALAYSTYLGGSNDDCGQGIAVDSAGNAYVTGYTYSPDFLTQNPIQGSLAGRSDAFVTKINAAGNALAYSTYLGGSSDDYGSGIAVDSSGNAYVVGTTFSTDFPTRNPIQGSNWGYADAFVAKISGDTNPSVTVDAPNGGEIWYGTHNILWTATDAEQTGVGSLSASLYRGPSASGPWTQIAGGIACTSGIQASQSWDTTAIASGTYFVRVVVSDGNGGSGTDISNASFKITAKDHTPPAAPVVTSPTHPSQIIWYNNNAPVLSWTASDESGINGYSYILNTTATTTPDTISEGTASPPTTPAKPAALGISTCGPGMGRVTGGLPHIIRCRLIP